MKRLYILRHSKAGQTSKKLLDDHERGLTDKGIELCEKIGNYLSAVDSPPQFLLCSSAERAKETGKRSLQYGDLNIPSDFRNKLYLADMSDLYSELHTVDDGYESVLMVGHNPGLHQFAMDVAGKGDKKLFREMRNHFPPPSLAVFDFDVASWGLVEAQKGLLVDFRNPKSF